MDCVLGCVLARLRLRFGCVCVCVCVPGATKVRRLRGRPGEGKRRGGQPAEGARGAHGHEERGAEYPAGDARELRMDQISPLSTLGGPCPPTGAG